MSDLCSSYSSWSRIPPSQSCLSSVSCFMYVPLSSALLTGELHMDPAGFGTKTWYKLFITVIMQLTPVSFRELFAASPLDGCFDSLLNIEALDCSSTEVWVPHTSISAHSLYWNEVHLSLCSSTSVCSYFLALAFHSSTVDGPCNEHGHLLAWHWLSLSWALSRLRFWGWRRSSSIETPKC